jgi:hypothetical protein
VPGTRAEPRVRPLSHDSLPMTGLSVAQSSGLSRRFWIASVYLVWKLRARKVCVMLAAIRWASPRGLPRLCIVRAGRLASLPVGRWYECRVQPRYRFLGERRISSAKSRLQKLQGIVKAMKKLDSLVASDFFINATINNLYEPRSGEQYRALPAALRQSLRRCSRTSRLR